MTDIIILTGALGAGKTTTLNAILDTIPDDEDIAVIVNEFAASGIDGDVITQPNFQISQGCICCTRSDDIIDLLNDIDGEYDRVIIETSGATLLGPFLNIVNDIGMQLRGIIYLVDASQPSLDDIEAATLIVINKTDLVSPTALDTVREQCKVRNATATLHTTSYGNIHYDDITSMPSETGTLSEARTHQGTMTSLTFTLNQAPSPEQIEAVLEQHSSSVARAKGFLGSPYNVLFQYAAGLLDYTTHERQTTEIVFIGYFTLLERIQIFYDLCKPSKEFLQNLATIFQE
jgi:G3E family GTPase